MKTFTLTFECDNAAFEDDTAAEIARVIGNVAAILSRRGVPTKRPGGPVASLDSWISDANGNRIGTWQYRDR